MLAEQVGPYGVGAGAAFIVLALIAALFVTDFPYTTQVKQLRAYPVLAGAFFTTSALAALGFIFAFVVLILGLH